MVAGPLKTVWMVSGNKGGVGKSLFCLGLASTLEILGEKFSILDGDSRVGDVFAVFLRKCPALQADFRQLQPGFEDKFTNCKQDSVFENMIHDLLKTSSHLIINTPDGADDVLMKWFDATLKYSEANNYLFKFMYLMSDRPDGLTILPKLNKSFSFLYPIRNLHFGSEDIFTVFNRDYSHMYHEVVDFPVLRGQEVRMLLDLHTYPSEAIKPRQSLSQAMSLPVLSRSRLQTWLAEIGDTFGDVIDNKTEPNTKIAALQG